jgi:pyroglutamyl-peptidase
LQPVRVLVTGFGPFPDVPCNASEAVVRGVTAGAGVPGAEIATATIPVVWAGAREVSRGAIARFDPHAILHFGVSRRALAFEIETRAFNVSGPKQDHAGEVRPSMPLVAGGRPILTPELPPLDLVRALRRSGYPAVLSRDAGRYLCNALFYWSLADGEADGRLVSFVHMPAFGADKDVKPRLTIHKATEGARILVRAAAEAVLRASQTKASPRGRSKGDGSQALHWNGRSRRGIAWRDAG